MYRWSIVLLAAGCILAESEKGGDRPVLPEPNPPEAQTTIEDVRSQSVVPPADVLFVVQETVGMGEVQQTVGNRLPFLFEELLENGADWHVGVVSSDSDDPVSAGVLVEADGQRWVDAGATDPMGSLSQMLALGEDSVAPSQPMGAAYTALGAQRDLANAGFLREEATLSVVVVSDGTDATDSAEIGSAAFTTWLGELKATNPPTWSCLLSGGGTDCPALASATAGAVGEATDGSVYGEVGVQASNLTREFFLSRTPAPATVAVNVHDGDQILDMTEGDWLYNQGRNSISFFEYLPPAGSEVHIRYEPLGSYPSGD